MKIKILFVSFFIITILTSCCNPNFVSSLDVRYLSSDDVDIIVRSVGEGRNEKEVIVNAQKNVFDALLFRGLSGSGQKEALIGSDEASIKLKHNTYFDTFYKESRYKTFIMSSVVASPITHYKGGYKKITLDIRVNLKALRSDLEHNGIVRKFGF